MTKNNDLRFGRLIAKYESSDIVRQMDRYFQHGNTTTYEHCMNVAWYSYQFNKKWNLHADEQTLVKSAVLHDLFLYDRHDGSHGRIEHRHHHADVACENASRYFGLTKKEKAIIRSHMWPINIMRIPTSREAMIVCMMDKYCAALETAHANRLWNYASRKRKLILSYVK